MNYVIFMDVSVLAAWFKMD